MNKIFSNKILNVILIAVILVLSLPNIVAATTLEKTARNGEFDQKMRLRIDYTITGPGDYRINSTRGCGWRYNSNYKLKMYLYVFSDYPTANWYEFLTDVTYDPLFHFPTCADGTIPFWWYWNSAGNDVAVLYANSYHILSPDSDLDWNVAITLP